MTPVLPNSGEAKRFAYELGAGELLDAFRVAAGETGYATARRIAEVLSGRGIVADGRMLSGPLRRESSLVLGFDAHSSRRAWRHVDTPEPWAGKRVEHAFAGLGTVTALKSASGAVVRWDSGVLGGAPLEDLTVVEPLPNTRGGVR